MIRHVVPDAVQPLPVARYVQRAWPMLAGHVVRDAFKRRDVKLNQMRCDKNALVRGGDELILYIQEDSRELELAFDDGRLVVAVKPQGLPVDVDADGIGADTLLTRLRERYGAIELCHRLDAATGGLVLAANDERVRAQALDAFRAKGVVKRYRALARGSFEKSEGTLKAWLVKDARHAVVRVAHRETAGGKPIETRYRVRREANGIAELELEPVTGRTHQLRAHMADFGHPLLGDDKYGDREWNRAHSDMRLCLWCETLLIPAQSPLVDYRGQRFHAEPPEWRMT